MHNLTWSVLVKPLSRWLVTSCRHSHCRLLNSVISTTRLGLIHVKFFKHFPKNPIVVIVSPELNYEEDTFLTSRPCWNQLAQILGHDFLWFRAITAITAIDNFKQFHLTISIWLVILFHHKDWRHSYRLISFGHKVLGYFKVWFSGNFQLWHTPRSHPGADIHYHDHKFRIPFGSKRQNMYCDHISSGVSWARLPDWTPGWFEFRVFLLLDWLPAKAMGLNLSCYLSIAGENKCIYAFLNGINTYMKAMNSIWIRIRPRVTHSTNQNGWILKFMSTNNVTH